MEGLGIRSHKIPIILKPWGAVRSATRPAIDRQVIVTWRQTSIGKTNSLRLNRTRPLVVVNTFLGCPWQSRTRPAVFSLLDGEQVVVKSRVNNPLRFTVNDMIVGALGSLIGAPVLEPQLVFVAPEKIANDPELQDFRPGSCYAVSRIGDLSNRMNFEYANEAYNRSRMGVLAWLYALVRVSGDQQLMYLKNAPQTVYSLDHEESFAPSGQWNEANLDPNQNVNPDDWIVNRASLTPDELRADQQAPATITQKNLIEVVARPPDEWSISKSERVVLAKFLWQRAQLLSQLVI